MPTPQRLAGEAMKAPIRQVQGVRFDHGQGEPRPDVVAEEEPVVLVYNGVAHAVMLATPADLEDFALGFSLSEGIVAHPDEWQLVQIEPGDDGISVQMAIPGERFRALAGQKRNLPGRGGCGLCGRDSLAGVMTPPPRVRAVSVHAGMITTAFVDLAAAQPLNARCHGLHAAGYVQGGRLHHVREDVGRHNAMDKLVGALAAAGQDAAGGFILSTARCSYEIVEKAVRAGATRLVTVSLPTSLAVQRARAAGLTLWCLARDDSALLVHDAGRPRN